MNEIISTKPDIKYKDYQNAITKMLDMHLKTPYKVTLRQGYHYGTYILFEKNDNSAAIRFPGATRGHIDYDENQIITKIVLYDIEEVDFIYKRSIQRELMKFIGMKLVKPEEKEE